MSQHAQSLQPPAPLVQALRAHSPESVCIIGPGTIADQLRQDLGLAEGDATSAVELAALVLDSGDNIPTPDQAAIARARDIDARRCLAWVCDADAWPDETLRSLGFSSVADALWGYNISDYKPVPDWLNPRHWANPELWDKHRW